MSAREQFANQIRADEAGSPGDKTIHDWQKLCRFCGGTPEDATKFLHPACLTWSAGCERLWVLYAGQEQYQKEVEPRQSA